MSYIPQRIVTAVLAVVLAVATAACGSGSQSASPPSRTLSPRPHPAISGTPTSTTPTSTTPTSTTPTSTTPTSTTPTSTTPTSTTPTSGTPPTTSGPPSTTASGDRPPAGGVRGQIVVLNCPVDRADSPCPGTPVGARIVVLDSTGRTALATVATVADGRFAIALPAGSYMVRATPINGGTARRPTTRKVTVSAERYTVVTIRLITGLR